jgi:hypothetical protein
MAPRHNPRRNAGAPVRFEDDDTYLIERPRDSTKPAWPKLLAQSTVPYDHTLSPVTWNTRPLDQPLGQKPKQPSIQSQEAAASCERTKKIFSAQVRFEDPHDFDMVTSESEGGESDDEDDFAPDAMVANPPAWSALEPALQLSIYEYVYRFLEGQKEQEIGVIKTNDILQAKAAEMLCLTNHELSDIEAQRAFRASNPLNEKYLQEQWLKEEAATMKGVEPLSTDVSQHRKRWQEINDRYIALLTHICKYTYANEKAIKLAKIYLKAQGLKPKVIGEWIEGEEETTMAFLSSQAADLKSPILLPVSNCAVVSHEVEAPPDLAVLALDAASHPPRETAIDNGQKQPALRPLLPSPEIRSLEEFAERHDPKPIRLVSEQYERGRSLVRASEIHLKVNSNGRAEIRKKRSKRPASSELRPSYHNEYVGGQRIVVLENGSIGFDVNAKITTEVESLLVAGFEASRHRDTTALMSRMQESIVPTSSSLTPKVLPRPFSDVLLGIDSDHMSTAVTNGVTTKDQGRQPYSLTSTPPQPGWSPIESLNRPASPSPSPIKSTLKTAKQTVARSNGVAPASTPLREVETRRKSPLKTDVKKQPSKQFRLQTIVRDVAASKETQASTPNREHERSSSVPLMAPAPSMAPAPFNNVHDSGLAASRATSNEPDIARRVLAMSSKTPQTPKTPKTPKTVKTPMAMKPQQTSSQKVLNVQVPLKKGKGSRGGPGSYRKRQKTNEPEGVVLPLMEKKNVGTSGGTSHAA